MQAAGRNDTTAKTMRNGNTSYKKVTKKNKSKKINLYKLLNTL